MALPTLYENTTMAIANAADPLKMSILQFNKHPFWLTENWFQNPHWP